MSRLEKKCTFSTDLLKWFELFGRKDLPWQKNISPYRVWISEIMLQQTQVQTVIPYFNRFMKSFPTIKKLAQAPLDFVLQHWAGLGYYARARHLHRTANIIVTQYKNHFPDELTSLTQLPGIGRSTAGAILSIAFQKPTPILDGNVKRVLARVHAIDTDISETKTIQLLWELATQYTPKRNVHHYTQAIMDLGATLCTRTKPRCTACPVQKHCLAFLTDTAHRLPQKKKRNPIPHKEQFFFLIMNKKKQFLFVQNPERGIWGGLWCFPHCDTHQSIETYLYSTYSLTCRQIKILPPLRHTFTHFELNMIPVVLQTHTRRVSLGATQWIDLSQATQLALPAPIAKILSRYMHNTPTWEETSSCPV